MRRITLVREGQSPIIIITDLLLSEHPETIEQEDLKHDVPIDRGEMVTGWKSGDGDFKRYRFTKSGVSPRTIPGTADTMYIAATDDHDEEGVLISDVFCNSAVRRKILLPIDVDRIGNVGRADMVSDHREKRVVGRFELPGCGSGGAERKVEIVRGIGFKG